MTEHKAVHDTFTIERTYKASPAHVFRAWSQPDIKDQWFGSNDPTVLTQLVRTTDFRVGGREQYKGRWVATGKVSDFRAVYFDIVPGERIVYAYDMDINDQHISVSLTTVEFHADGAGTRLVFTEQGVYLDDYADNGSRKEGTGFLLDKLGEVISTIPEI